MSGVPPAPASEGRLLLVEKTVIETFPLLFHTGTEISQSMREQRSVWVSLRQSAPGRSPLAELGEEEACSHPMR